MPLLQTGSPFLNAADSRALLVFAAIVVGFLVILFGANLIGVGTRRRPSAARRSGFNRRQFRRTASGYGLNKNDIQVLEHLIRVLKIQQPFRVFSDPRLLDDMLSRAVYSVENNASLPDPERQDRLGRYFRIKQLLERNVEAAKRTTTTTAIPQGQEVTITPEDGGRYPSKVTSNLRDYIALETPHGRGNQEIRLERGSRVKVNHTAYSFVSKVHGYETIRGTRCVLIKHSKTVARDQLRRHRRRVVERPCFVIPIQVAERQQGNTTPRKAMLQDNRRAMGTIVDVSAGGCSVRSMFPLEPGRLAKVEFEFDRRSPVAVFGKVQRVHAQRPAGGLMHLQFTRLSRKHLNLIHRFVYDFADRPRRRARSTA